MRNLLQLASWGIAATVAIAVTVIAAQSDSGQERLQAAMAALTGTATVEVATADASTAAPVAVPTVKIVSDPEQIERLAATEVETRRLTEMVRSLNTDRERLLVRLAAVERNLEDVTGSVRKQVMQAPQPEPPAIPRPAPVLAEPPATTAPPQDEAPAPATPAAAPERVASLVPPGETAEGPPQQPAVGVDVGNAPNFDGLRALWTTTKAIDPSLFEGLQPIVGVRENTKTHAADLRLIVGPFVDIEAVGKVCAALTANKRACRPAAFEGQPLALDVAPLPRRAKAPERKAPSAPPPPPRAIPAFQDR